MFITKKFQKFTLATLLMSLAVGGVGCGSSNPNTGGGGGGGAQVSTDATTNQLLITTFVSQFANLAGIWTNNLFGSMGDFTVQSSFDENTGEYTITIDINGNVFGVSNPLPEQFTIPAGDFISNGTMNISLSSATYGDIMGTLTFFDDGTGTFEGTATNIPSGATNAQAMGSFTLADGTVIFQVDSMSFDLGGSNITVTNTFN